MILQVEEYFGYDELPKNIKSLVSPPYSKYDLYSYIVSYWPNGEIQVESDHMEPEDATFYRDLKWIKPALERVRDGY